MKFLVLALTIPLQPLVSENVLEPSVRNEVDHALSRAPQAERVNVVVTTNSIISVETTTNKFKKITCVKRVLKINKKKKKIKKNFKIKVLIF